MKTALKESGLYLAGLIMGIVVTSACMLKMIEPRKLNYLNGYDKGYKQAQIECAKLIKNTR